MLGSYVHSIMKQALRSYNRFTNPITIILPDAPVLESRGNRPLHWNIETFFAWWKRHLKVYHVIARSEYGLMVQMIAGLITYLLLAIYCHEEHNEKVSIKRVREFRINIQNESRYFFGDPADSLETSIQKKHHLYANS